MSAEHEENLTLGFGIMAEEIQDTDHSTYNLPQSDAANLVEQLSETLIYELSSEDDRRNVKSKVKTHVEFAKEGEVPVMQVTTRLDFTKKILGIPATAEMTTVSILATTEDGRLYHTKDMEIQFGNFGHILRLNGVDTNILDTFGTDPDTDFAREVDNNLARQGIVTTPSDPHFTITEDSLRVKK